MHFKKITAQLSIFITVLSLLGGSFALASFEDEAERKYGIRLAEKMTRAKLDRLYKEIHALIVDYDLFPHVQVYDAVQSSFDDRLDFIATPSLARKARELFKDRGYIWSGSFSDPQSGDLRPDVAERVEAYSDASRAMVELLFRNITGTGIVLSPDGEMIPAPAFGASKELRKSSSELAAHYESEKKRLEAAAWPKDMNESDQRAYKRAEGGFDFFHKYFDVFDGMSEEKLKGVIETYAKSMRALRSIGKSGLSDQVIRRDESLRNEVQEEAREVALLSTGQVKHKVLVSVADSLLVHASTLFDEARFSPLYSELSAALCERAIDKAIELAGPAGVADAIHRTFVIFAFEALTENHSHVGYFTQKLLHRIASDAALTPMVRTMAGALLSRANRTGRTMYVQVPSVEKLAALYTRIPETTPTFVMEVDAAGGRIKKPYLRIKKSDYRISIPMRMLDEEIEALGIKKHAWVSYQPVVESKKADRAEKLATVIPFRLEHIEKTEAPSTLPNGNMEECEVILLFKNGVPPKPKAE